MRRIYRVISCWADISAILAAGNKPNSDDIAFLLCLGEPVPPDVQAYVADRYVAPPKGKEGRPSKHPDDQLREAGDLFAAIHKIRIAGRRPLSVTRACAIYAEANKLKAESVERQYRAAKKKLFSRIERVGPIDATGTPAYFLTAEDHIAWEKANLKKQGG